MKIETITENNIRIALVKSSETLIMNVESALDFIATVSYETGSAAVVVNKEAVDESFFDLRTGIAGEIIQKFVNYRMKLAIIGDFSGYDSKSLKDFIYECNNGKDLFFFSDEGEAVKKLKEVAAN